MRLVDDMRAQAVKLESKASAYRLAGDGNGAQMCRNAAWHLRNAVVDLEELARMERGAACL